MSVTQLTIDGAGRDNDRAQTLQKMKADVAQGLEGLDTASPKLRVSFEACAILMDRLLDDAETAAHARTLTLPPVDTDFDDFGIGVDSGPDDPDLVDSGLDNGFLSDCCASSLADMLLQLADEYAADAGGGDG